MFTGIVQGKAEIRKISGSDQHKSLVIAFPPGSLEGLSQGASIAINGTCLTVTDFNLETSQANFDVIKETLEKTNLGDQSQGSQVNFERAARIGDEIGGHLMSGHVHTTVRLQNKIISKENCTLVFETPTMLKRYLLEKGFVGLNGCSLTLGKVNDESFEVHLIPETLSVTTFGDITEGSRVNLEIDPSTQAIVDTVERVLADKAGNGSQL